MWDVTKRLKEHVWCVIIFAAFVILVAASIFFGGKGNEIVSYVSFAAAICSIILAVIAIFISIVQHSSSQQNRGEIRNLVEQASKVMGEKADKVSQRAQSIEDVVKQLMETTTAENGEKVEPQDTQPQPEISRFHSYILLTLYSFGQSYDKSKGISMSVFSEIVVPDTAVLTGAGFLLGIMVYIQGLWGEESWEYHGEKEDMMIKFNIVPEGLTKNVRQEIGRRIPMPGFSKRKEYLERGLRKIDAYFEAA